MKKTSQDYLKISWHVSFFTALFRKTCYINKDFYFKGCHFSGQCYHLMPPEKKYLVNSVGTQTRNGLNKGSKLN